MNNVERMIYVSVEKEIRRWIQWQREKLFRLAVEIQRRHMETINMENRKRGRRTGHGLVPIVRRHGNNGSFSISWRKVEYERWAGRAQRTTRHIRHGKSAKYDLRALRACAKEWEYTIVVETEERFAMMRQAMNVLGAFERSLGKVDNILEDIDFMAAQELGLLDLDQDLMGADFRFTGCDLEDE